MIEKNQDKVVVNYTSNQDIKEYVNEVLVPRAFPHIPMNKLNLGLVGIVGELIAGALEDTHSTTSLLANEAFITRAILPKSIYSSAALFNLGYSFAIPSRCNFVLQVAIGDILQYAKPITYASTIYRYVIDKDTKLMLGDNNYRLPHDIYIETSLLEGKRIYNVYYSDTEECSISHLKTHYIKHQVTSIGYLVLFLELMEFDRKVTTYSLTDNLVTNNSDLTVRFTGQIAGMDIVYIDPQGNRASIKLKTLYTLPDVQPFVWYRFLTDNTIILSFSSNQGYWTPAFNSKLEVTVYTCRGAAANFDSYDRKTGVPVQKVGSRFSYNANTKMVGLCYSGSYGGADRGSIEDLRRDTILAYNTAEVLVTDHDLDLWFETYGKRHNTRTRFFKRRDDPTGRLWSQFVAIIHNTEVFPTNTLTLDVDEKQFDLIYKDADGVDEEFIIKPGHLWTYADEVVDGVKVLCRDRVRMVESINTGDEENKSHRMATVTDVNLPSITEDRPFMFVNPFFIKIHRDPCISASYNYLLDDTSWPEDVAIESSSPYQFQLATFHIERNLSSKYNNMYHLEVICVPVVTTQKDLKYVEGVGEQFPVSKNNLRMVLITRTAKEGETGYIEMIPTEIRQQGSIVFSTDIAVYDNLVSDMTIEVDLDQTPGMVPISSYGPNTGRVFMDSQETSFHFVCLMKDQTGKTNSTVLYNDGRYTGYMITNRFANANRDLTLYQPLSMMRSTITFTGENNNYNIRTTLCPMLKWDLPLDEERMMYFIRLFNEQYKAMEPILEQLNGNDFLDFKLYNTYGRSNNYYIGPKTGEDVLRNSDILLDDVYVQIKFRMSVYDRSLFTQTVSEVKNEIIQFFDHLAEGTLTDVHVSNIIHQIECNHKNVRYLRFLGFNHYDANKQSIFVKYTDISELREDQLQPHVPEMIRCDAASIEIMEEV